MIYRPSRVRQVSLAALLLSTGVILGTVVPRARGAVAPVHPASRPQSPQPSTATGAARGSTAVPIPAELSISAPPDADAPTFGGSYAVLSGASTEGAGPLGPTDGAVPRGAAQPPPTVNSAVFPGIPPRAAEDSSTITPADTGGAQPSRAPAGFRPSPAQGIPRGIAADYPLLAVIEGGGRLLFYDLGVRPGAVPTSIEGVWAMLGDCGRTLQADFSASTEQAGELRAIGRGAGGSPGSTGVVTARQGCEAAASRYTRSGTPSEAVRAEMASFAPDGFDATNLVQVAQTRGVALLVFRSAAGSAAVIATRDLGGFRGAWSKRMSPADGDLSGIGVFRRGGTTHVWLTVQRSGRPYALLTVTSPDGNAWSAAGPVTLANR